jgi:hypothetical protein
MNLEEDLIIEPKKENLEILRSKLAETLAETNVIALGEQGVPDGAGNSQAFNFEPLTEEKDTPPIELNDLVM